MVIDTEIDSNDPVVNKESVMKKVEDLCKDIFKEIDDRRDYEFEMAKKIVCEAKAEQQAAAAGKNKFEMQFYLYINSRRQRERQEGGSEERQNSRTNRSCSRRRN